VSGNEPLAEAVVATGFAPNEASLRPMVRGIAAVGSRARTVRMIGSHPPVTAHHHAPASPHHPLVTW